MDGRDRRKAHKFAAQASETYTDEQLRKAVYFASHEGFVQGMKYGKQIACEKCRIKRYAEDTKERR